MNYYIAQFGLSGQFQHYLKASHEPTPDLAIGACFHRVNEVTSATWYLEKTIVQELVDKLNAFSASLPLKRGTNPTYRVGTT